MTITTGRKTLISLHRQANAAAGIVKGGTGKNLNYLEFA